MLNTSIERMNAVLRAAEYKEAKPLFPHELHLRTDRPFPDLAEAIGHLLWAGILQRDDHIVLDAHRFPSLVRVIDDILSRHLQGCASIDKSHWDAWAHTGGGAPTRQQRPPVCVEHTGRIQEEAGSELNRLLCELEKAAGGYLSQHVSPFESESVALLEDPIRQTVQGTVKTYLIKNIASSCCDACQEQRGQPL